MFTTPARPVEVVELFPELAVYAKSATRLHPRRGVPVAGESSVAGPMLWPAGESWPTCRLPHVVEVRREASDEELDRFRQPNQAQTERLVQLAEQFPDLAAGPDFPLGRMLAMREKFLGTKFGPRKGTTVSTWQAATPAEPVRMVPVVQLHTADIPEIHFPDGTDLLQILWCPFQHPDVPGQSEHYSGPAPKVIWRTAGTLTDTVTLTADDSGRAGYLLQQCVVHPEPITEYPDTEDLPEPLQDRIHAWQDTLGEEPSYDYRNDLSVAPGLKTGGWPYWPHCPRPIECDCGSEMSLLLTLPHGERGARSWTPIEDRFHAAKPGYDAEFHDPTGFTGARDELLVFVCRQDPRHEVRIDIE